MLIKHLNILNLIKSNDFNNDSYYKKFFAGWCDERKKLI